MGIQKAPTGDILIKYIKQGFSQSDLARRFNVDPSTINYNLKGYKEEPAKCPVCGSVNNWGKILTHYEHHSRHGYYCSKESCEREYVYRKNKLIAVACYV